jgi:hypothetical protein
MVDFRKLFLALAVLVLVLTTVASAQTYHCDASAGSPLIRSEGIAEIVGDIVLNCSGNVPTGGIQANIRVQLNTNITSNVLSGSTLDAVLLVDELASNATPWRGRYPTFPDYRQNIFQGTRISDTEVEFNGVVLSASGSSAGIQQIRIKNVRANASALGTNNGVIFAIVNITGFSGTTAVPVNNAVLRVADTRPGLIFNTRATSGSTTDTAVGFRSCVQPGTNTVRLIFTEGFASSFRIGYNSAADHTVPNADYGDESGFNPGAYDSANTTLIGASLIGVANQGTRLFARLSGIPSGIELRQPGVIPGSSVGGSISPSGSLAVTAISGPDSAGLGSTSTSDPRTVPSSGRIAYEVTTANTTSVSQVESVIVDLRIVYGTFDSPNSPPNGPWPASVTAKGSFAPLSTVFTANADAKEPRFVDNAVDKPLFTIGACRTILLFPFVSQIPGWDTGIAISNTSADPLGTLPQAGACTLNYYGTSGGTGAAPSPQTTQSVPSGSQVVGSLSSGGSLGFPATVGFQGYIIAVCNFQYAHGYAFISDLGAQKLAQGYLALVIPDIPARDPANRALTAFGVGFNEGEQLAQ